MRLKLREGFAGQDMYVIPRPVLAEARRHPLVRSAYPTDIGWYPHAKYHWRKRPNGCPEDHLMLCIGGHGYVEIEGKQAHLQEGQALIIPRNRQHFYWAEDDDPWSIYWMHFLGVNADYYIDQIPKTGQAFAVESQTQKEAVRLFRDCLETVERGYTLHNMIYAAQTAQHVLSLLLFRNAALAKHSVVDNDRETCDAVIEFMRTHLTEAIRLDDFASEVGLSVSRLSQIFKQQTHYSPKSYLSNMRIRTACRLLDFTDKSVKAVAMETGFIDPYYFSRVFKKVMGISPDKYRRIVKA